MDTFLLAVAATATLQYALVEAQVAGQLLSEGEGGPRELQGENPIDAETEDVAGGGEEMSTTAPMPASTPEALIANTSNEALVLAMPTTAIQSYDTPRVPSHEEGLQPVKNLEEREQTTDLAANEKEGSTASTLAPGTTFPVVPNALATEESAESVVPSQETSKPSLRTQDPTLITDTATNNAAEKHAPGYLDQGINPVVFIALAGICCVFLLLWGRKRRLGRPSTSSSTSGGTSAKGPQVQYTQVPEEQPFSHNQDDDDEFCDDYEEDTFANDRDNWDDWEAGAPQTQEAQLNPFASPPSVPRPTIPRQTSSSTSPFKLSQPLPPPPLPPQQQQHVELHEVKIAGKEGMLPSSVESNSSSDSFEVVPEEVSVLPTSAHESSSDAEKESVDDLFSQFGMVPTFKKTAVVPPPPTATSQPVTTPALSATTSALPTAAEASALFAAEMDDELTAVDAADEWGEDDEWVKGI